MSKARLSEAQLRVVDHGDGPLLVVAGPGSGKTRVLTERIRRLLTEVPGHFRVLALTFTNKAANEMMERLSDLGDARRRAFIGTLHGFCLEVLSDRGKHVGVESVPSIFEQAQDRKQILVQAVSEDPLLGRELDELDSKERSQRIDLWLRSISSIKTHPISSAGRVEPLMQRVYEAYNAGLRACGAYDFDDLLLLTYQLFSDFPKVAEFYRRLYRYVCIDEAQDLNEAQYAVLKALSGAKFNNVMMVGDPKQSIYGFNNSSPEYLQKFKDDFGAVEITLQENFRSSKAVVRVAQFLDKRYMLEAQLPIPGDVLLLRGDDEAHEAKLVVDTIERIQESGHPDVEGPITPNRCAILGRTRFVLLAVERELESRSVPFFKRLSSAHENESKLVEEFELALRVFANPRDAFHWAALHQRWGTINVTSVVSPSPESVVIALSEAAAASGNDRCRAVAAAIHLIHTHSKRLDLLPGIAILEQFADKCREDERRAAREDLAVLRAEWDQYLRTDAVGARSVSGFMSSMALGTTGKASKEGVALLTVHSSKGLEFDVVFVIGMADGVFPDYRARGKVKLLAEEQRNAFVAVTRSKRLLILSYPRKRTMPWGEIWVQTASPYLAAVGA